MDDDEGAWERRADDAVEVGDCGEGPSRPTTPGEADDGGNAINRDDDDDDPWVEGAVVAGGQILVPAC